jgi:hypothetical protein
VWRAGVVLAITAAAWAFLGVVAAAIIGPTVSYFAARRNMSGNVKVVDAATMFMEMRENRNELIQEVHYLRGELREALERERVLRERVWALEREVSQLGGFNG